jgi:hypothetical protein
LLFAQGEELDLRPDFLSCLSDARTAPRVFIRDLTRVVNLRPDKKFYVSQMKDRLTLEPTCHIFA